jgi:hypothetical protein
VATQPTHTRTPAWAKAKTQTGGLTSAPTQFISFSASQNRKPNTKPETESNTGTKLHGNDLRVDLRSWSLVYGLICTKRKWRIHWEKLIIQK